MDANGWIDLGLASMRNDYVVLPELLLIVYQDSLHCDAAALVRFIQQRKGSHN
jgi:hypothetical protein